MDRLQRMRVAFESKEQYRVLTADGEVAAEPAGRLRAYGELPVVGDWVLARQVDPDLAWMEEVEPRTTVFARRAAGSQADRQLIAANIDVVLLVAGLDHDFNPRRLERYLVLAQESGARPVIVLNKADLCPDLSGPVAKCRAIAPQTALVAISAQQDATPLLEFALGNTVVLLGSSGAGKSTIANALLGESRQATNSVREHDSRGRHTTTSRMLIPLPGGGALIDTPGMRELGLVAGEESLNEVFAEIAATATQCRFADCTHSNEPGCAVLAALAAGTLDAGRWQSYLKLQREARFQRTEADIHAQQEQKRRWKVIHKAMRHNDKRA